MSHKGDIILAIIYLTLFSVNIHGQDLIPLQVNNYWEYEEKILEFGKTVKIDTVISKVERSLIYKNKKWYVLNELGDKLIVRNSEVGHYELDTLSIKKTKDTKERLIFVKPEKSNFMSYTTYNGNKIMIDKNLVEVETTIGKFECIKYMISEEGINSNFKITICIKPGIGIISHITETLNETTTYKLINYKLQ